MRHVVALAILLFCVGALHAQSPAPRWTRMGHIGGVTAVAISPDSRYLASAASSDDRILVWDIQSQQVASILRFPPRFFYSPNNYEGYIARTTSILFTQDVAHVIAADDSMIYEWDLASGKRTDSIVTHSGSLFRSQLSSTEDTLLTVSSSGLVSRYDRAAHRLLDSITFPIDFKSNFQTGHSISFSRDLDRCAFSLDTAVIVFDLAKRTAIHTYPMRYPSNVLLDPRAQHVLIAAYDTTYLVDLATGQVSVGLRTGRPIRFTESGDTLLYRTSRLMKVNVANGDSVAVSDYVLPDVETYWPSSTDYSPDGRFVAIARTKVGPIILQPLNGAVLLVDLQLKRTSELTGNQSRLSALLWSPVSDVLTVSDDAGVVKSYAAQDGAVLAENLGTWDMTSIPAMRYMPHSDSLIGVLNYYSEMISENQISYFSSNLQLSTAFCQNIYYTLNAQSGPNKIVVAPKGSSIVADGWFISGPGACNTATPRIPADPLDFSPDGSQILLNATGKLLTYDIAKARTTPVAANDISYVSTAAYSPDGNWIAVGHADSVLELVTTGSGNVRTPAGRFGHITSMDFSSDSRYLVTSGDSSIVIWDLATFKNIFTYQCSMPIVQSGISYDSKYIAATDGSTIAVWDAPDFLSVSTKSAAIPIALSQNAPNPVREMTQIDYALPIAEEVSLVLFDAIGNQVAVLDRGRRSSGEHRLTFDAKHLPRGVYFYRLETVSGVVTRRLIVD